jgi:hypothetical protein
MPISSDRRPICLALATLTLVAGLAWRFAPLGLPPLLYKYGGSALWAVMIYWIVATIFPHSRATRIAILACLIAAFVEIFRLYHAPTLDEFRLTLGGRLLLGRVFSIQDIAAYWLAIGFTAAVDSNASHDHRA